MFVFGELPGVPVWLLSQPVHLYASEYLVLQCNYYSFQYDVFFTLAESALCSFGLHPS